MSETRGRLRGRLSCWAGIVIVVVMVAATAAAQSGPATTTVADTVYRADGTAAQGTLAITWPAFTTASGSAVAAGTSNITLPSNGALSSALVPNVGASPAGVYYTVVYQLNDGTAKTEYWLVGTASPETLATVRTTPGSGIAAPPVSLQYVNSALATKANDNAVVHLGGVETISGTKSFSAPPNVPAPANSGDVANKSYVDSSVAAVGSGNFLPTAGGTMTGTLTLNGNPAAPLQASPKQYVDAGLAAKADLTGGHVPVAELGSGTVSGTSCLLGNGSWGACGSSSNAISIQGTPVASSAPANGQVLTYSASSGQYAPQAGGGQTAGMQVVKWATDYNWSQTNTASLTTPGAQTLTLSSCPTGVTGTEPYYYIYISGTGTAEAALVTGGTCAGNGASGTLQFTTANAHAGGYTIGSASSGLQEGLIAGRTTLNGGGVQGTTVFAPAGEFPIYARVSFRASNQTVDFTHAVFDCYVQDACLYIGDPANANYTQGVTLIKPRGKPMVTAGTWPMIETNGQVTRLVDVSPKYSGAGITFGTIVQVDGDQSFTLDGLNYAYGLGTVACTTSYCGAAVTAPGPFGINPAVGHIKNANISMQCSGNGVDWESGNTLEISDSVVQGYSQYGVRGGLTLGGYGNMKLVNVYEEGGCPNLLGNIGTAGLVVNGGPVFWSGGEGPSGATPVFANTGSAAWQYYVVARHATYGPSNPLYAGSALTNGSGTITVTTADIPGAASFDLLKVGPPAANTLPQAPYGTGNYAVVTSVARSTACSGGVCTFSDTQTTPAAYTVATPSYFPKLSFWPGGIVLGASADGNSPLSASTLTLEVDDLAGGGGTATTVLGTHAPSIYASKCPSLSGFSPVWLSCLATNFPPETVYQQGATVLATKPAADGGLAAVANLKGRLNFSTSGSAPGHIITLVDTNFQKTVATAYNRPSNDVNDTYLGIDQGGSNSAGLSLGSALSISEYIGNVGDGTHFLERLAANAKTFNVPVTVNGQVTLNAAQGTAPMVVTSTTVVPNLNANLLNGAPTASVGTAGAIPVAGSNGKLDASWLQGIGTVNSGSQSQVAIYSGNGASVSGDAGLTDNGTTLSYSGSGGVAATTGTFSGNLTVNGQLLVAGPWMVSSPIPGTAMGTAGAGTSSLGISNDGNFYISANGGVPQKVATSGTSSYFSNLIQEDANDLGEQNGGTPQSLHVYSNYANSSTWQRTSLGYDATDNYAVVRSENAVSGNAPGLGFWINSGLKWVVDASGNFKPWTDQTYSLGSFNGTGSGSGLRPGTVYVAGNSTSGSGFELGRFANESYELCNDTGTGTIVNGLAVLTTAGCAAKPSSALTSGAIGVVIANAGTSGVATLARAGSVYCSFDGTATVVGDYVVASSTASSTFYPLCHDAGATRPTGTQILGRVLQASAGSATVQMFLDMPGSSVSSGTATGSCTNQAVTAVLSGGPTCTTITSAYVDSSIATAASPALTGTPTAPTATAGDNSTKIATTAYVRSEVYSAWSCPVAGTTAVTQNCNWTLPVGITVTGFDLAASTAAAGCTTYPVLQVWDGTSGAEVGSYSIAFASGTNFFTQVTGSTNVAAGHLLRLKITTAAAGCTTNAAGIVATLTYQMQN